MSITGLALLGLLGAGAAAGPTALRGKPMPITSRLKNMISTPVLERFKPNDYKTIEQALSDTGPRIESQKSTFDPLLSRFKLGHIFGTVLLGGLGIPKLLEYFNLDEDSIWMKIAKVAIPFEVIGAVVNYGIATFAKNDYVESMKGILDNFVTRFRQDKNGKMINVQSGADESDRVRTLNDLIMPKADKMKVQGVIRRAQTTGVGINAVGPTGVGKSSTAFATASGLLKEDFYLADGIMIWVANKNCMEGTLADNENLGAMTKMLDGMTGMLGLGRFTGETIPERIERIMANAVKHHRDTGEHVIIVLEEAHELLGKSNKNSTNGFNAMDPFERSQTAEDLGRLFEEKLKKAMCKGVVLISTSNASINQVANHLLRRLKAIKYKKPRAPERLQKIQDTLRKYFETVGSDSKLTKDGITLNGVLEKVKAAKLQKIGTVNLLDRYFSNNEEQAKTAGYGGYISALQRRNILHYEHIEDAINDAILNYSGGGVDTLVDSIKVSLRGYVTGELENRDHVLEEVKFYTEVDSLQSIDKDEGKITGKYAHLRELAGDLSAFLNDAAKTDDGNSGDSVANLLKVLVGKEDGKPEDKKS